MSLEAILGLIQAILKLSPEVITLLEKIFGKGSTVDPAQVTEALTQVATIAHTVAPTIDEAIPSVAPVVNEVTAVADSVVDQSAPVTEAPQS